MSAMERDGTGKMADRVVRGVALRQKPEGAEGAGLWLSAGRTFQRGLDKGTDPEFGGCLVFWRKSKEASGIATGREL